MKKVICASILIIGMLCTWQAKAQEQVIDEVVAVVGSNYILASDIETQYIQYRAQGTVANAEALRCQIFEDMLFQKLMLNQAELDSIEVTDDQVNQTMDARFRYFIAQFGSQEKMEKHYKKSLLEIREEFRPIIKDQLMVEEVQQGLIKDVKVTPAEVRKMFSALPKDSVPVIASEIEIGQIVKMPEISKEELDATRDRIKQLRDRIMAGEDFGALAVLYSEDPGSSRRRGEVGFVGRGQLYPEYEAAAFQLKKGEVSEIIKTQAGYHIIQMLERRGEQINTRHILIRPKISTAELNKASNLLDSIANLIRTKQITFEEAALKFSDDPNKISGGLMVNPATGNTRFPADVSDPGILSSNVSRVVKNMNPGDVSGPVDGENDEGKQFLQIVYVKSKTEPHMANLREDYTAIQEWALNKKKGEVIDNWLSDKIQKTYFNINDAYKNCNFKHNWSLENQ